MILSDLVGIGRLGGADEEGFFQLLVKPRYRDLIADIDEVFLIFNSDRVFFVTISERDISDRKIRLKFAEDGVAEERRKHRETIVAIASEPSEQDDPEYLLGYTALWQDREVGKITDYFHNNAQFVLEITTPEGVEILVPMVDYYIGEVLSDPKVVVLTNAESLISDSENGK